jgi:TRAP-type transport system periplasmic protein
MGGLNMNKKVKLLSIITAVSMISAVFTGCLKTDSKPTSQTPAPTTSASSGNKDVKVIKISNGASQTNPSVVALNEKFKKIVEEKTNGRYKVEVYHSAQLGDDVKGTEAVRAGTLEMCYTSTAPLVGFAKEMAIFDIPFLFTSEKVADAVLDGAIGQKLSNLMAEKGMVLLGWGENGFRNVTNSVKEVKTPADLKGLKIRTMDNAIHLSAWKLMGANPTPMSFAEVFTALQQHAIDGQENPVPLIYSSKFYEVNKYLTLTGHVYSPMPLFYSKQLFDKLPKEDQTIIMEAARETNLYERKINREALVKNLEDMKKAGTIVTELTPEQKKTFQDLTAPVWKQVEEKVGADLIKDLKDEITKASK